MLDRGTFFELATETVAPSRVYLKAAADVPMITEVSMVSCRWNWSEKEVIETRLRRFGCDHSVCQLIRCQMNRLDTRADIGSLNRADFRETIVTVFRFMIGENHHSFFLQIT
jgi:hypothetical protein